MPTLNASRYNIPSRPARKIGILGGSFNPAHDGHRYISLRALERLNLDEIWWLVSPQNPLKDRCGMAPFDDRIESARRTAHHPRIRITDLEAKLGTRNTIDTLRALKRRYPFSSFVWIMGADNLIEIPRWKNWRGIFGLIPIAVFARQAYSLRALSGQAARVFASRRIAQSSAGMLSTMKPPAWVFLNIRPHAASATGIRAKYTDPASTGS